MKMDRKQVEKCYKNKQNIFFKMKKFQKMKRQIFHSNIWKEKYIKYLIKGTKITFSYNLQFIA